MAASMWRMNGLWRRMAGVLVLCTLLLSNKVVCQDTAPSTTVPTAASPTDPAAPADPADPADPAVDVSVDAEAPAPTAAPTVGDAASVASGEDSAPSAAPGDNPIPATIITIFPGDDSKDIDTSSTTGTTIAPLGRANRIPAIAEVPDESHFHRIVPSVQCVGKEDIPESNAVRAMVVTDNCEATKHIIQENPASWCRNENCNLEIFQDGNTVLVSSKDAGLGALAAALQSEHLKDKLGVTKTETPSSAGSSVFVGILVSGLLAALGITVGYFKCQRRPDPKGVRLAEEAYPVDQENQANTLVSVAPLNPPPETQEKPSVNGESPEAAKTQPPPPTNGHSTAKTADTEL